MQEGTQPKPSDEALRASELRYRRLFEAAQDGILILNAKTGQIDDVNPFLVDLLGYSHDEFIGTPLWEIGPFRDFKECKQAFEELQDKEYIRYDSLPLETRDGRPIAVEFVSNVYRLNGDGTRVIQCNIRDLSKRKQSEAALRRSEQQTDKQPPFHIKTFLSKAGAGRTIVDLPEKQVLFEQGKRGDAVFHILTGMVKLSVVSQGKEVTIGLLGPGNFAGKDCMATIPLRRTTSARTFTHCTLLRIERKEMLRVVQQEKAFAAFFLDHLLARNILYQEVIMDQLLNSGEKRLARALLLLANFGGEGRPETIVPRIGQEELAEMVGTTRSRINVFMNRFRKLGFVAYKGKTPITIRTAKLARFVMA
ncbi:MAG: PAS domain S-box protein [Acidobacteriota bacterium]|nr:PAS domain S-box protein [Acidobacteriota bacterium]